MTKILYIGNQLNKHGFNKTSIETLGPLLGTEGYKIYFTSSKKNQVFRLFDMMLATLKHAKKVDFIIIDTYSTSSFWYAFICSQISRFFKTKYIPILHGGNLPNRLQKNPKLCNLLFKNAYKNVAPSQYLKVEFEKRGYNNIVYIPNTITLGNYNFKERSTFEPKLLWVRAFASIYNPEMAVHVLYELQKTYPKATLTMVGPDKDGSLEKTKILAKKLNVAVTFTGQLPKEKWLQLAKEYDIFINTTHFDNTPVSVIEAMALGLAIVSTNVGGIPYLLTHQKDALLVKDNDVIAMKKAVIQLLENNLAVQLQVQTARKQVESFDWPVVKSQWNILLQKD